MFRVSPAAVLLATLCALLALPAEAVQRAYVASWGNNANTATGCPVTAPCRQFLAAVTVVDPNGEVVALDTGAYGAVTIAQSISLTSAPGAYAGISVFSGAGVTIATAGISVTLRGLTINSQGGSYGISMTNGAKLSVENCVISNFSSSGYGVYADTAATIRIVDSIFRDNYIGVVLRNGAKGSISGSKFLGNSYDGIAVWGHVASTTTTADVSDTVVTGSTYGMGAWVTADNAIGRLSVIRSTSAGNSHGIDSEVFSGAGASAVVTVSDSMVTGNTSVGLYQSGVGATLKSLGNNTVSDNTANTSGTITAVPPM